MLLTRRDDRSYHLSMIRTSHKERTRERLLDEGVAAFREFGFHGTGLQHVLDRAGIPKGSFYNYFGSKEEFGAATILHFAEGVGDLLARELASASDPLSGLRGFFGAMMEQFEESGYVGGCLLGNLGGELEGSAACREALAGSIRALCGGIRDALSEAQEQGLVRRDIEAEEMANLLVETWEGGVIRMKIERTLEPVRRCQRRLLDDYFQP